MKLTLQALNTQPTRLLLLTITVLLLVWFTFTATNITMDTVALVDGIAEKLDFPN